MDLFSWQGIEESTIWASLRENLFSGFATRWDSDRPAQLQIR